MFGVIPASCFCLFSVVAFLVEIFKKHPIIGDMNHIPVAFIVVNYHTHTQTHTHTHTNTHKHIYIYIHTHTYI